MLTQPNTLINMFFTQSRDIPARPFAILCESVCVSWKFQKHRDFILATTCADTKIRVTLYALGWQT